MTAASPSSKSTKEAEPNALAIGEALHAAAAAIYFNDSSDYETALWTVVRKLAPGIADMLEKDASTFAQIREALASSSIKEDGGGGEPDQAEFELHCGDEFAASASGPRDRAWAEIQHYAAQYQQDGPIAIYEVTRRLVSSPPSPLGDTPEQQEQKR